jgi:hypothetical protein
MKQHGATSRLHHHRGKKKEKKKHVTLEAQRVRESERAREKVIKQNPKQRRGSNASSHASLVDVNEHNCWRRWCFTAMVQQGGRLIESFFNGFTLSHPSGFVSHHLPLFV